MIHKNIKVSIIGIIFVIVGLVLALPFLGIYNPITLALIGIGFVLFMIGARCI